MDVVTEPQNVISPKENWTLARILVDRGHGQEALALGFWGDSEKKTKTLCIRWTGFPGKPKGNPISNFQPTWFVVPDAFHAAIVSTLDLETQSVARKFFEFEAE